MELIVLWIIGWFFSMGFYIEDRWNAAIVLIFIWPIELGITLGKLYDKLYNE